VAVAAALRTALTAEGLRVRDAARPPFDHRFVAVDVSDGRECTVEVFADGGRLRARVALGIGPVLHPDDLAADKVLALWGRARPRDFVDVAALLRRFTADRLLELAAAKDAGFEVTTFAQALRSVDRLGNADWAEDGIPADVVGEVRAVIDGWAATLAGG
jgi:hypothetical protein